jgi:hypothetical protein
MAERTDSGPLATGDADGPGGPRNVTDLVEMLRVALQAVAAPGEQLQRLGIA